MARSKNVANQEHRRNMELCEDSLGVRPVLHLNLSRPVWTKGKEVTSEDKKAVIAASLPSGISNSGSNGAGVSDAGISSQSGQTPAPSPNTSSTASPTLAKVKSLKVTNKKKGKTVLTYKKVSGAAGYQIQYAKNKKFTKGKKSKTTKKVTYTIKSLKKKTTYYFRVRAYKKVSGKKKYGKWSAVKKLKIKK